MTLSYKFNGQNYNTNIARFHRLIYEAVGDCELDLTGFVVLTEAALGAYVVTPIIAAIAGAKKVYAIAKTSPYGSAEEAKNYTLYMANQTGVQDKIEILTKKDARVVSKADIITNSGHLRPIDSTMIECMKPTAVISLMYESWEFRNDDIDIEACREKEISIVGINERHPSINVFSYLGTMAVKLLMDAGLPVIHNRIILLCDNDFEPFIVNGLRSAGADVTVRPRYLSENYSDDFVDAVLVALKPGLDFVIDNESLQELVNSFPGIIVAQFWGDIDREFLDSLKVQVYPSLIPRKGHMGILPSHIGVDPVINLQTGNLKVAELYLRRKKLIYKGKQIGNIL